MPVSKTKATIRSAGRKVATSRSTIAMREKALAMAINVSGVEYPYAGSAGGAWAPVAQYAPGPGRSRFIAPDDIVKTAAKFAAFLANG